MSNWVCLNCKSKNQENMKFCPICHLPRSFSERTQKPQQAPPSAQNVRQMPFPYQTDTPAAAPNPAPQHNADAATAVNPPAQRGGRLRVILIAANAVCLVLNIVGIVILLK